MDTIGNLSDIGISLMIVGMAVVFSSLVILMFLMKGLKNCLYWLHCRKFARESAAGGSAEGTSCPRPDDTEAMTIAAIAMTLILEEQAAHDEESLVLTLRAMAKPYSNWWMPGRSSLSHYNTQGFRPMISKTESTI
ncbi:MAG: OadG family protein [FCB group bacterium]|nr:OadG family protein [FCB group bacterium]